MLDELLRQLLSAVLDLVSILGLLRAALGTNANMLRGSLLLLLLLAALARAQFQEFVVPDFKGFHDPLAGRRQVTCGAPGTPVFGRIASQTGSKPGDTVTYVCSPGHKLVGPATKKCTPQGYWAPGRVPKCKVIIKRENDNSFQNNDAGWVIGESNV